MATRLRFELSLFLALAACGVGEKSPAPTAADGGSSDSASADGGSPPEADSGAPGDTGPQPTRYLHPLRGGGWQVPHVVAFDSEGALLVFGLTEGPMRVVGEAVTATDYPAWFLLKLSTAGELAWHRTIGSANDGNDWTPALSVGPEDAVAVAAPLELEVGDWPTRIVVFDREGAERWEHTYVGTASSASPFIHTVDFASNGGVVTAGVAMRGARVGAQVLADDDNFIARHTSAGTVDWVQVIQPGSAGTGVRARILSDGRIVVTGGYSRAFTIADRTVPAPPPSGFSGSQMMYVAALAADGQTVDWLRSFVSDGLWVHPSEFAGVDAGSLLIRGAVDGRVDFGDGVTPPDGPNRFMLWMDEMGTARVARPISENGEGGLIGMALRGEDAFLVGNVEPGMVQLGGVSPTNEEGGGGPLLAHYDSAEVDWAHLGWTAVYYDVEIGAEGEIALSGRCGRRAVVPLPCDSGDEGFVAVLTPGFRPGE